MTETTGEEVFSPKITNQSLVRRFVSQGGRGYLSINIQGTGGSVDPDTDSLHLGVWYRDVSGATPVDPRGDQVLDLGSVAGKQRHLDGESGGGQRLGHRSHRPWVAGETVQHQGSRGTAGVGPRLGAGDQVVQLRQDVHVRSRCFDASIECNERTRLKRNRGMPACSWGMGAG